MKCNRAGTEQKPDLVSSTFSVDRRLREQLNSLRMKIVRLLATSTTLLVAMGLTGCETPSDTALLGAASGAAIGGLLHGRADQALVGAAIGAGGGYLAGKVVQKERRRSYEEGYYQGRTTENYPVGRPSTSRGLVVSPYRPYNLVDVRGIPSGARVVDPSCNKVFINP